MDNQEEFFEAESENQPIFSLHEIRVDSTLKSLQTSEGIKRYAKLALRRVMGDDAEISKVKFKKPGLFAKAKAKLRKEHPNGRLYVTTKF